MVFPELSDFFHDGVGGGAEEFFVLREGVVFPEVEAVPGGGGGVPFPTAAAEDAVFGLDGPAADGFSFDDFGIDLVQIVIVGGVGADGAEGVDIGEKGRGAFGEVGDFGGPVVHFDVDVGVVVAA